MIAGQCSADRYKGDYNISRIVSIISVKIPIRRVTSVSYKGLTLSSFRSLYTSEAVSLSINDSLMFNLEQKINNFSQVADFSNLAKEFKML